MTYKEKRKNFGRNRKFRETYVMMYALETLHNRGITVKETVYESIHNLNQWYEQSGNYKYLELALLHMQAYANMGFALDEADLSVQKVLEYTGKTKDDFFPKRKQLWKKNQA